ncbi:hypothetical protein [Ruegeria sp. HKCCD8929]|uniref:hypothetical protein n=1 Tax=Ruegeria sp. HKCCD8929 TaxID=2683006 RepID=UPI0014896267|nr:hypothetical protein [Ruegeria sp. HKCCD8929]
MPIHTDLCNKAHESRKVLARSGVTTEPDAIVMYLAKTALDAERMIPIHRTLCVSVQSLKDELLALAGKSSTARRLVMVLSHPYDPAPYQGIAVQCPAGQWTTASSSQISRETET